MPVLFSGHNLDEIGLIDLPLLRKMPSGAIPTPTSISIFDSYDLNLVMISAVASKMPRL